MRFRLIALIGLVLGLSRLAFPATLDVKHGSTTRTRITQKHRKQKLRPRPVRRAPAPRQHQITPLIEAPELRLSLVTTPAFDTPPLVIRAALPGKLAAKQPWTIKTAKSIRQLEPVKPLRLPYWTAEGAAADAHVSRDSRFAAAPNHLVAMGNPHLAYDQQRAFTLRMAIRL